MVYILDTGLDPTAANEINLKLGPTYIDGTGNADDDNGHGKYGLIYAVTLV